MCVAQQTARSSILSTQKFFRRTLTPTPSAGIRFLTHRTLYHNTVKVADVIAEETLHVNAGLKPQDLAEPAAIGLWHSDPH